MDDSQQLELLRQGAEAWNRWRKENPELSRAADLYKANLRRADLRGANLREADLREANLYEADLTGADLRKADLRGANLRGANLREADLREADLTGADLFGADLTGADLYGADLREADLRLANLSGADLREADLTGAKLLETIFSDTELRDVQGLDACIHDGPSILDHRTLAKSGQLPLAFLRGCGLPDKLIDYLPSLLNEAIQFYSCFIAYDHTDKDFARRLYDTLQGRGIRCWLDEKQLRPGDDIHEEVDRGIRLWDKVLSRRTTLCSKTARSLSRPWRPSDHLNQCRL